MPLAGGQSRIAHGMQGLRQSHAAFEAAFRLLPVETGEQRSPSRLALGGVVKLSEAQTFAGELVDVRRMNFAPITTDVAETHVIGEENNDVRSPGCGGLRLSEEGAARNSR